jgi:hypothetical protein
MDIVTKANMGNINQNVCNMELQKGKLRMNRGRNSVTIQRCSGEVTAPIKSKTFGCRSLFIRDTFRNKTIS